MLTTSSSVGLYYPFRELRPANVLAGHKKVLSFDRIPEFLCPNVGGQKGQFLPGRAGGRELVAVLEGMLAETELRVYRGKKIVETKPMWANKGALANELLAEYSDAGFILSIGDDRTDEDLFARLPADAWSIHVGPESSKAGYRLADTIHLREQLHHLAEYCPETALCGRLHRKCGRSKFLPEAIRPNLVIDVGHVGRPE